VGDGRSIPRPQEARVVKPLPTEPPEHVTDPAKCWGRSKRTKKQCGKHPIPGSRHCGNHAGSPKARAHAEVRVELAKWTLGTPDIDPAQTLLQLLAQSRTRVEQYATRLAQLVDEHGGDLAEAMVSDQYVMSDSGHLQKVGEYIRGLAQLEADERDRCANFARLAIAAGIAERQVRLAEQQGALMATFMRAVLGDAELGLSPEQRSKVPMVMQRHLQALPAAG
jgi:hypothetical protein